MATTGAGAALTSWSKLALDILAWLDPVNWKIGVTGGGGWGAETGALTAGAATLEVGGGTEYHGVETVGIGAMAGNERPVAEVEGIIGALVWKEKFSGVVFLAGNW